MSPLSLDLTPLAWPGADRSDAASRRWACQALGHLAAELDAARHAHTLLCELLADHTADEPGQLGARLAAIDDAAVPAHDGAELHAVLRAHRLDDAAARLRRAHQRRRDAVQALRQLAHLDRHGLLDLTAARVRLHQVADDLVAVGQGVADVDRDLLSKLADSTNLADLADLSGTRA